MILTNEATSNFKLNKCSFFQKHSYITIKIDKPKNIVYDNLIKTTKSFFVQNDIIEIEIKPQFFDPFAPRGSIRIELSGLDNNASTKLKCNVTQTSFNKTSLYLIAFFLIIWTIFSLIFFFTIYMLLTILAGWLISYIVIRLTQTLNIGKLENYLSYTIQQLSK
jgi:hypothetical protein